MELRARQRIGDGHADVVGAAVAHHLQRGLDVVARLARVAELQEEADAHPGSVEPVGRASDLLHRCALLHRVEDALRAGLGPQPDDVGPGAGQRQHVGLAAHDQVGPAEALERQARVAGLHLVGEARPPAGLQAHDVVGEPDVAGGVGRLQPGHLFGHALRAARVIALAPDGLGAPVAMVGAAAGRHHVHGVAAVAFAPQTAIALYIYQIPGWEGQVVHFGDGRAARVQARAAVVAPGQAANVAQRERRAAGQVVDQFDQCLLAFAQQYVVRPGSQIGGAVVAGVGAGNDDRAAPCDGQGRHGESGLAHAQEAHLGQIVEVVFVDDGEARPVGVQRGGPLVF